MPLDEDPPGGGRESAFHFLGACIASSWGLALAVWLAVGPARGVSAVPGGPAIPDEQARPYLAADLLMALIPGLVALLLRLLRREEGTGFARPSGKWRDYGAAYLLGTFYLAASFGIGWATGLVEVGADPHGFRSQLAARGGWTPSDERAWIWALALNALTLSPLLLTVLFVPEEYGWRGYLLSRLEPLGRRRAIAVSAASWSAWQLPLFLLQRPYESVPLWAAAPLAFVVLAALGAVLALLCLESRSVWVSALLQAVVISQLSLYSLFVSQHTPVVGSPVGVAGLAVLAAVLAWAWRSGRFERTPGDPE